MLRIRTSTDSPLRLFASCPRAPVPALPGRPSPPYTRRTESLPEPLESNPGDPLTNRTAVRGSASLLVILAILLSDLSAGSATAGAASSPDPLEDPLAARAQAAMQAYFGAGRSPDGREGARAELLAVADTLASANRDSLAALCLDYAGILTFHTGRLDEAQAVWARALAHAESTGDPGLTVRCLNSRAVGYGAAGNYEKAISMFAGQLPIRESLEDLHGLGTVWGNLSGAYQTMGRIPESIEAAEHALRFHRETGNPRGLSGVYGTLAELLISVDNLPQATVWADSSVEIARRHDLPAALGVGLAHRADAEFSVGRY